MSKSKKKKPRVGSTIKIVMKNEDIFEGDVAVNNKKSNIMCIDLTGKVISSTTRRSLCFVNTAKIKKIVSVKENPNSTVPFKNKVPPKPNWSLVKREKIKAVGRRKMKLGKGVSTFGQKLFDELSKTLDCVWDGKFIVVVPLGYKIENPYNDLRCVKTSGKVQDLFKKMFSTSLEKVKKE